MPSTNQGGDQTGGRREGDGRETFAEAITTTLTLTRDPDWSACWMPVGCLLDAFWMPAGWMDV
jgi:hypothetical protein